MLVCNSVLFLTALMVAYLINESLNLRLQLHPFNGNFSRTTWVSRHQKGKPFWILLEQEMTGWQWHQLDHMQIICTSLQTDNHASTSPLNFAGQCPSFRPTNSVKALKVTSSSAIAEGLRDALSQLKSCQLLHNCTKNHI